MMMKVMLRMSRLQIFDMDGYLREYREVKDGQRSFSEFSVPLLFFKFSAVSSEGGKKAFA